MPGNAASRAAEDPPPGSSAGGVRGPVEAAGAPIPTRARPSGLARSPLDWSYVDRGLLGAITILPFTIACLGLVYAARSYPSQAPYVNQDFLRIVLRLQWVVFVGGWAAYIAVGFWLRRRAPDSRLYALVGCHFYASAFAVASYYLGHYTSPFGGVVGLSGILVIMLLAGPRAGLATALTFAFVVGVTTGLEQAGLIPYAPLLARPPVENGQMAGIPALGFGIIMWATFGAAYALVHFVVIRWRESDAELARTSDDLARANEVISRYVASQLAAQIAAGNYDAVEKHERLKLTLVFCDIKGFAELADRVEPEVLSELLDEYLCEMTAVAERHGGFIDKFVGDAMMVFFGAPMPGTVQKDALSAVRMALEMQARAEELQERWRTRGLDWPFEMRIGINTGQATVGNFGSTGRRDYTAIGRQVNLAARLQAACEGGRILIGHSTWVLVRDAVECAARGELHVKGFHAPVLVYEVVAAREQAATAPAAPEAGEAPAVADGPSSRLGRLLARAGNPLDWSAADKVLLGALTILPFALYFAVILCVVLLRPDLAPYLDPTGVRVGALAQTGGAAAWLAVAVAAIALRRRAPQSRPLAIVGTQLFALNVGGSSYFLGHYTSPYGGLVGLAGVIVMLLLFERPVALGAIVSFAAVIVGTTLLEQLRLIPYAPLIGDASFMVGHLPAIWGLWFGVTMIGAFAAGMALTYFIIDRWRDCDEKLARTSELLARANEIISRYVGSQLAEQIFAGRVEDRHARRSITLFFSDIKDFAEIADELEAEDLSQLLNEYLSEMVAIAEAHGGFINKFVGDAIMILFGAPVGTGDAAHAVRMALEMQTRVRELARRWQARGFERAFEVRMGINSGLATVGHFGSQRRRDYTAIGRQVSLAASLQAACEPGKVLISHSTWVLVQDAARAAPRGELQVKGLPGPVRVYELGELAPT
jgi:class 3 adenylate cyclase